MQFSSPVSSWMLLSLAMCTMAYKHGAPTTNKPSLCLGDMTPNHGVLPLTTKPFYEILVDRDCYTDTLTVTVNSTSSNPKEAYLQGLLLVARAGAHDTKQALGTFTVTPGDKFLNTTSCFNKKDNALTHITDLHQPSTSAVWTAPKGYTGDVQFQASIVWHTEKFFVNVRSKNVKYSSSKDVCYQRSSDAIRNTFSLAVFVLSLLFIFM